MAKILVIDDSATSRAIFRAYLPKEENHILYEAADYESALDLAKKYQPDICVIDYNIPDKNGVEIAVDILQLGLKPALILMTANIQFAVLKRAKEVGFKLVLEKPINAEKVKEALGSIHD